MKTKPLTFLLALTFLFLFSGSSVVFADDLQDGWDAFERKDYKTAHKLLLPLAEQGNEKAHLLLVSVYYLVEQPGVPHDYEKAIKWYRLAAEQGDLLAQYYLGKIYANR